jgi:anti-sigma-K factor RskA
LRLPEELRRRVQGLVRDEAKLSMVSREGRGSRSGTSIVWPVYLVAAVCFALAVASSLSNLSLMEQLKTAKARAAALDIRSRGLARNLAGEEMTVADLMSDDAHRYDVTGGQVVVVHDRIYLTMHDMAAPPRGKIYQAWTLARSARAMTPSATFLPDAHGAAVVALPGSARATAAIAVSVEPEGGARTPSSPLFVEKLEP